MSDQHIITILESPSIKSIVTPINILTRLGLQGPTGAPGTGIVAFPTFSALPPPGSTFPPNNISIVENDDPLHTAGLYLDTGTQQKFLGNGRVLFTQAVASTIWFVAHGLGHKPASIATFDTAGDRFFAAIENETLNSLDIAINTAIAGTAILE